MHHHIALIGAPTDVGASVLGASMGPDALRIAGLAAALRARGCSVHEQAHLHGPANPQQPAQDGVRHLPEVSAWCHAVFDAVAQALSHGQLPLLLGGDHSLAIGSISAAACHCRRQGKRLRVLWLDAHADANRPSTSPSGNLHGMPVACLLGDGPARLNALAGQAVLAPHALCQIGLRSVDEGEKQYLQERAIEVYDMRSIDELGMRAVMEQALAGVDAHTHLHVSLDLDCIDPDIAPGVGTPARGGLNYREMQLCMEMLADCAALGSLDVMELNPALDVRNQTAQLAVDLIESLFGKSTLVRPR